MARAPSDRANGHSRLSVPYRAGGWPRRGRRAAGQAARHVSGDGGARLRPEDHVVAMDDLGKVAVGGKVVRARAANGRELRGRVVREAAADHGARRIDQRDQIAGLEGTLDADDAHGEEAAAVVEQRTAGARVEN